MTVPFQSHMHDALHLYLTGLGFSVEHTQCQKCIPLTLYRYGQIELEKQRNFSKGDDILVRRQMIHFVVIAVGPTGKWSVVEPFEHSGRGLYDLKIKIDLLLAKENYFRVLRIASKESYKMSGGRNYRLWTDYTNTMRSVGALPPKSYVRPSNLTNPHSSLLRSQNDLKNSAV